MAWSAFAASARCSTTSRSTELTTTRPSSLKSAAARVKHIQLPPMRCASSPSTPASIPHNMVALPVASSLRSPRVAPTSSMARPTSTIVRAIGMPITTTPLITTLVNGVNTPQHIKPKDLRKIYGFTVGGALIKDKLFWIDTYDQHSHIFPVVGIPYSPQQFYTLPAGGNFGTAKPATRPPARFDRRPSRPPSMTSTPALWPRARR